MTTLADMEYYVYTIGIPWTTIAIALAVAAGLGLLIVWRLLRKRGANRGGS